MDVSGGKFTFLQFHIILDPPLPHISPLLPHPSPHILLHPLDHPNPMSCSLLTPTPNPRSHSYQHSHLLLTEDSADLAQRFLADFIHLALTGSLLSGQRFLYFLY